MEDDEEVWEEHPISVTNVVERSYEKEIIQTKYNYIEHIVNETLFYKEKKKQRTDKADALLTHPIWGVPMFLFAGKAGFSHHVVHNIGHPRHITAVFQNGKGKK